MMWSFLGCASKAKPDRRPSNVARECAGQSFQPFHPRQAQEGGGVRTRKEKQRGTKEGVVIKSRHTRRAQQSLAYKYQAQAWPAWAETYERWIYISFNCTKLILKKKITKKIHLIIFSVYKIFSFESNTTPSDPY